MPSKKRSQIDRFGAPKNGARAAKRMGRHNYSKKKPKAGKLAFLNPARLQEVPKVTIQEGAATRKILERGRDQVFLEMSYQNRKYPNHPKKRYPHQLKERKRNPQSIFQQKNRNLKSKTKTPNKKHAPLYFATTNQPFAYSSDIPYWNIQHRRQPNSSQDTWRMLVPRFIAQKQRRHHRQTRSQPLVLFL